MTFLLDTNTCIVAINDVIGRARARMREEERRGRPLLVSSVSVLELYYGAKKSARLEVNVAKLRAFLEPLIQAPFDSDDAEIAGGIRADLEKKGRPIGAYDCLIAGQALRRGLTLVTDNEGEFRRVNGLRIENWVR
jgi:tRNA(fMet)-specific endonuclease VapC